MGWDWLDDRLWFWANSHFKQAWTAWRQGRKLTQGLKDKGMQEAQKVHLSKQHAQKTFIFYSSRVQLAFISRVQLGNTQIITHDIKIHICQAKDLHTVQITPRKFNLPEKCFNLTAIFARHPQTTIRNAKKPHVDTKTFITDTPT